MKHFLIKPVVHLFVPEQISTISRGNQHSAWQRKYSTHTHTHSVSVTYVTAKINMSGVGCVGVNDFFLRVNLLTVWWMTHLPRRGAIRLFGH